MNIFRSDIIIKSGRLQDFKNNPQKFIDGAIKIIKKSMSMFIVDGIKYQKLGDEFYYAQECFETQELYGYLSSNMIANRKNKSIGLQELLAVSGFKKMSRIMQFQKANPNIDMDAGLDSLQLAKTFSNRFQYDRAESWNNLINSKEGIENLKKQIKTSTV